MEEEIEKLENELDKPKKSVKKTKSKVTSETIDATSTDTIESPKKDSHTILIITEKPQAALKIADALSNGSDRKYNESGVPFYEFNKGGKKIIVGCAVGHLFGIAEKKEGTRAEIPSFSVEWAPVFEGKKGKKDTSYTKKYYMLLKKLAKQADEFIVATDYDIEGEVIGWNVVRFIAKQKDAKRMKYSSLTKDELNNSFENASKSLDWGQAYAGETRHIVDWYYGINLSRALMRSLSKAGRFRIMSIGRVQGPALGIIVDKELQIKNFKPEPYWQVFLLVQDLNKQKVEVKFPKDLTKETELLKFKQLKGKKAEARTEIKEQKIFPPAPFDLTTLQTESYRLFGLTPSQTLAVAQKLYLGGLISYPRTSSQKLPEAIGYDKILKQLEKNFVLVKYAVNKKPAEGKKSDPAHPAIYPTGEFRKLEGNEKRVFELVVKRFVSCFCNPAIIEDKKIIVSVNGLDFIAKGMMIREKGWAYVYPSTLQEEDIPTINGEVEIKELRIEQKMTMPPKRYTASSLLKELEKRNLGTKATRANIIETLYDRGYIKEKSIEATPIGMKLIETLKKHSPIIIDDKLTRKLEKEMNSINIAKKDLDKKEERVLEDARKIISEITTQMRKDEENIGKELAEGNEEMWQQEKEDSKIVKCSFCKQGDLRILFNKNYRRYFIGCSNYPNCKKTFSMPPNALIRQSKDKDGNPELCKECGFPMMIAFRKQRKPWKFCFNTECPSNKEWVKKRDEYALSKQKEAMESKPDKIYEKKSGNIAASSTSQMKLENGEKVEEKK